MKSKYFSTEILNKKCKKPDSLPGINASAQNPRMSHIGVAGNMA
jgi:hypothetical protein